MAIQLKLDDRAESARRLLLNEPIHPGHSRSSSRRQALSAIDGFHPVSPIQEGRPGSSVGNWDAVAPDSLDDTPESALGLELDKPIHPGAKRSLSRWGFRP